MISLPKNPKIEDLVPILDQHSTRLGGLETYVTNNDARITALERRYDQVIVIAAERIANLEADLVREKRKSDQLRWMTRRRRRRGKS